MGLRLHRQSSLFLLHLRSGLNRVDDIPARGRTSLRRDGESHHWRPQRRCSPIELRPGLAHGLVVEELAGRLAGGDLLRSERGSARVPVRCQRCVDRDGLRARPVWIGSVCAVVDWDYIPPGRFWRVDRLQ